MKEKCPDCGSPLRDSLTVKPQVTVNVGASPTPASNMTPTPPEQRAREFANKLAGEIISRLPVGQYRSVGIADYLCEELTTLITKADERDEILEVCKDSIRARLLARERWYEGVKDTLYWTHI